MVGHVDLRIKLRPLERCASVRVGRRGKNRARSVAWMSEGIGLCRRRLTKGNARAFPETFVDVIDDRFRVQAVRGADLQKERTTPRRRLLTTVCHRPQPIVTCSARDATCASMLV